MRHIPTSRKGISRSQTVIEEIFGWIFREQTVSDYGIDAQIETVADGNPTGKLIGAQIKTGSSHFHKTGKAFTYYISQAHYEYWTNHCLPVIIIACLPNENLLLWEVAVPKNIIKTRKGYKIQIPMGQKLARKSQERLATLAEGPEDLQRLRKLILDRPLIERLSSGDTLSVEYDDWIHKSLGRTHLKLFANDTLVADWRYWYLGMSQPQIIGAQFPWANQSLDDDFYDLNCELDEWEVERYEHSGSIHPYAQRMGEVDLYRVKLELNEFGTSLLHLYRYLDS